MGGSDLVVPPYVDDPGAVERMVDATAELPVDAYDSTVAVRLRRVPVDEYEISAMLAAGGVTVHLVRRLWVSRAGR